MAGTFKYTILFIGLSLFCRVAPASPGNEVFKDAEEAYLEGDFELGTKKIEEIIEETAKNVVTLISKTSTRRRKCCDVNFENVSS